MCITCQPPPGKNSDDAPRIEMEKMVFPRNDERNTLRAFLGREAITRQNTDKSVHATLVLQSWLPSDVARIIVILAYWLD
jgi:hypothetical protein